jgi:hypothetical protein
VRYRHKYALHRVAPLSEVVHPQTATQLEAGINTSVDLELALSQKKASWCPEAEEVDALLAFIEKKREPAVSHVEGTESSAAVLRHDDVELDVEVRIAIERGLSGVALQKESSNSPVRRTSTEALSLSNEVLSVDSSREALETAYPLPSKRFPDSTVPMTSFARAFIAELDKATSYLTLCDVIDDMEDRAVVLTVRTSQLDQRPCDCCCIDSCSNC